MSAPVTTDCLTAVSPQAISLPANILVDDVIVGVVRIPSADAGGALSLPAGYVTLQYYTLSATNDQAIFFARIADGTEGATFDATVAGTAKLMAGVAWKVSGAEPQIPACSGLGANSSTNIATQALGDLDRPARAGALIALFSAQSLPTASWANYSDLTAVYTTAASGASACSVGGAVRYGVVETEASLSNGENATNWSACKVFVPTLRRYGRIPRGVTGWDGLC